MSTADMVWTLGANENVFNVRVRRVFYVTGWVALTVLATGAVWWGLRPLLAPTTPLAKPSPSISATPAPTVSPTRIASPSAPPVVNKPKSPTPESSTFEGWSYVGGVFTRSFDVMGGTATIRIIDTRVELLAQAPKNGYTFSALPQTTPQRLVVRFDHPGGPASIIDAMWYLERPYAEVSEVK